MNTKLCFLLFLILLASPSATAHAANAAAGRQTYCNPMDIDYKYNFEQLNEQISYRSAADPVIVLHQGEYYLFATISGGWWHSKDMKNWDFVTPSRWPFDDICAPAALSVKDHLYLYQSNYEQRPILEVVNPRQGQVEFFNRLMPRMKGAEGPGDPALFHDPDTDRWFMYFGSSNVYPIQGIECDFAKKLAYSSKPKGLIWLDPDHHGWERFGQDHRDSIKPFIEGAWMTKREGKYYLQYAAPGTEYNVYATGTYVGRDPMGPFTYAPNNPVAYRPGGFACGIGHGNVFEDLYDNYWLTGTCWIGLNWGMERRLVMVPAGFDREGQMFSDTRFADFPHYLPASRWQKPDELFTGWMLLSYRKPVQASSSLKDFPASHVTDENIRTYWVAEKNRPGESLTVDLQAPRQVQAVQVNYIDHHSDIFKSDDTVYTQFRILGSLDGNKWNVLADLSGEPKRDRPNAYIHLPAPARARYIRYEHIYAASPFLAISDFRIFGNGDGPVPGIPQALVVNRDKDPRNAFLSWKPVNGAVGYNVRWGIDPRKLYQTYQVWADRALPLEIRALTTGQRYYFAVEAFNENGVSRPGEIRSID